MPAPYDKDTYFPLAVFAFEQVSVTNVSVGLTAATLANAKMATVNVEAAQIRYRVDGTAPTATVGAILEAGDELIVWGTMDINAIRFIRTGGVSATLNVHYSR